MRYARAPELAVRTSISRSWSRRWLRPLQQADCMCRLQCARGRCHGWAAAGCPHADVGQAPVRWRITTDCAAAAARPKPCCLQGFDKGRWAAAGMARHLPGFWSSRGGGVDGARARAGSPGVVPPWPTLEMASNLNLEDSYCTCSAKGPLVRATHQDLTEVDFQSGLYTW